MLVGDGVISAPASYLAGNSLNLEKVFYGCSSDRPSKSWNVILNTF